MANIVSITSQGQISIPANIRRRLALGKTKKARVSVQGNKVIVEPIVDLLALGGLLKSAKRADWARIRREFECDLARNYT